MKVMNYATRQVVTVSPRDSIDRAISMMEEHGFHHLVVAEHDRIVGLVSDRDILISTGWMLTVERRPGEEHHKTTVGPTRIEQIMSHPVRHVSPDESAKAASLQMIEHRIGALVVLTEGRLVGILTETDLLKSLDLLGDNDQAAGRLLERPVRELMQARVVTVTPRAPLSQVVDIFRKRRIRHAVVAVDGTVLGIISDRDVRRALGWSSMHDMMADVRHHIDHDEPKTAHAIMSAEVATTSQEATVRTAIRDMLRRNIHSIVVTEQDRLIGIITQTDIVRAIAREDVL